MPVRIETSTPPPQKPYDAAVFSSLFLTMPRPSPQYQDEQGQPEEVYDEYAYPAADVEGLTDQMQEVCQSLSFFHLAFLTSTKMNSNSFYSDSSYDAYDPTTDNSYYAAQAPVFIRQPVSHIFINSSSELTSRSSITTSIHLQSRRHLFLLLRRPTSFRSRRTWVHFCKDAARICVWHLLKVHTSRNFLSGCTHSDSGLNLPEEMQGYHSLIPLENIGGSTERRKFGNWHSTVYRAINSLDGGTYCLRRIESTFPPSSSHLIFSLNRHPDFRLHHQAAFGAIETWANIRHPGVVAIHEAFTTHAFGDSSLVVAYAYHPKAQTLFDAHLKLTPPAYQHGTRFQPQPAQTQIPERTLWSYIVQLAAAIKRVHDAGQALRMIDVTKVLVTSKNRCVVSQPEMTFSDVPTDSALARAGSWTC